VNMVKGRFVLFPAPHNRTKSRRGGSSPRRLNDCIL